jgi:hypothetical protein
MVAEHPDAADYLGDVTTGRVRRLSPAELGQVSDAAEIIAGFSIPERSVNTVWVADRLAARVRAAQGVTFRGATPVVAVRPEDSADGPWRVEAADGMHAPFDRVLNALWEGRLAIDATAGLPPDGTWSHRYRLALFLRTAEPVRASSAIVSTGPFGDIKSYDGRQFYLSWYPAGLVLTDGAVRPPEPALSAERRAAVQDGIRAHLGHLIPAVRDVLDAAEDVTCDGGWVFAQASGSLSDPRADIHRRDRFGLRRRGGYLSIDTGKYSTAPSMALDIAREITGG